MRIYNTAGGAPLQSGIRYGSDTGIDPHTLVRGVVTATYPVDDPSHPMAQFTSTYTVFCDVLVYSAMSGSRSYPLKNCLVLQPAAGLQTGQIRKPRAATGMVGGGALDYAQPGLLDGDNVVVAFLDGNITQPVVIAYLEHPHADVGNDGLAIGHRKRLQMADGDPNLVKHHGCFYGVDDAGNIVVDASQGNSGALIGGNEATGTPGKSGNATIIIDAAAAATVKVVDSTTQGTRAAPKTLVTATLSGAGYAVTFISGTPSWALGTPTANTVTVAGSGSATTAKIGDGSDAVALASAVQTNLDLIYAWMSAVSSIAVVATSKTLIPVNKGGSAALAPDVASSKITIPKG